MIKRDPNPQHLEVGDLITPTGTGWYQSFIGMVYPVTSIDRDGHARFNTAGPEGRDDWIADEDDQWSVRVVKRASEPFAPGTRVVYRNVSRGNSARDGATGTVRKGPYPHDGIIRTRVEWDRAGERPVPPYAVYTKNITPILTPVTETETETIRDGSDNVLREIVTVTTEYEIDTHHDEIAHPSHYAEGRKYEPKDVIRDWGLGFNLGAVVKYVARAGRKADTPTLKDLRKARQFLDFEIQALEAEEAAK